MAVVNLTDARVRALPLGSGIHRDERVKGLMVVCHKTTKTYAVQGDVRRNGRHVRTVRVKIDRVDRIGLAEARRRAKALMSQIQSGVDPTAGPDETGITLAQALEEHIGERSLRPTTERSYREHVEKYLKRFRSRAVTDITRQDCRELLDTLTERHGRTTAAAVMRTLRLLINTAMRIDETIDRNPMEAVRIPIPRRREVGALDLPAFWRDTEELARIMRDIHRTFMMTGARRTSVLTLGREDVDLERRVLRFGHMKTGGQLLFPMGPYLTEMLASRLKEDEPLNSRWLWPSPGSALGHVREPKRDNIPSPHVLRHHARTLMIAAGVPYAESALLLGHRLPGASGGYVHPEHLVEALRPHAEAYERLVLEQAKI
jgi:integrase